MLPLLPRALRLCCPAASSSPSSSSSSIALLSSRCAVKESSRFGARRVGLPNYNYNNRKDSFASRALSTTAAAAMSGQVTRVTMFKIASREDQEALVGYYEYIKKNQSKDGKPYILSLEAGPLNADARSKPTGHDTPYTFVSKTVFASKEDFDFYDTKCEAHAWLKQEIKKLQVEGPPLMVYFTPTVVGGTKL